MRQILPWAAIGSVALIVAVWFMTNRGDPNRFPDSWDLAEIAKVTPPFGDNGPVHILAWRASKPQGIPVQQGGSCLAIRNMEDGGFFVVHLYRGAMDTEWRESMMHVMGEPGTPEFPGMWYWHYARFEKRPSNCELYAACDDYRKLHWNFDVESDVDADCAVCETNWFHLTGERPTRLFPPVERKEELLPWMRRQWVGVFGG
jgi:hypothetical protein